jgi:hypothetical protein
VLKSIEESNCRKDTLVIVVYDEFGGTWDHVPPPGLGGPDSAHDQWGPGTRIPALIISPFLRGNFVVDRTPHDTTSIAATIERRFNLAPLGTRDARSATFQRCTPRGVRSATTTSRTSGTANARPGAANGRGSSFSPSDIGNGRSSRAIAVEGLAELPATTHPTRLCRVDRR